MPVINCMESNKKITQSKSMYKEFLTWLEHRQTGIFHRELLTLSLPFEELIPYCQALITALPDCLLLSKSILPNIEARLSAKTYSQAHIKKLLGTQCDAIIFDARTGIDLSSLYAATGLVAHKGIILVIMPCENEKNTYPYAPIKFSYKVNDPQAYFIDKFYQTIKRFERPIISPKTCQLPLLAVCTEQTKQSLEHVTLSVEQSRIKEQIIAGQLGHTKHIILGARGRGKSTLLGAIAYEYLVSHGKNLVVTAPNKPQIVEIERYYASQCQGNNLTIEPLKFLPPDQCLHSCSASTVLIIDEVASIAPSLVQEMVSAYDTVILSGTTNGYEGSGQGFVQRLLPFMQAQYLSEIHHLKQPFRWLEDDPVEALFDYLLCTNKALSPVTAIDLTHLSQIKIDWIDKHFLLEDEMLYDQVFRLLQTAHYQTTPNDIVRILDSSDHNIALATVNCSTGLLVLGVVVVIYEGGSAIKEIAKEISYGNRRVQGHLTAQSLSLSINNADLCSMNYMRVTRIAIASSYRRRKIGSQLLDFCYEHGRQTNIDWFATSFGLNDSLLSFWRSMHFTVAKIGNRIDTSSGTNSVILVRPVTLLSQNYVELLQAQVLLDNRFFQFLYASSDNNANATRYIQLVSSPTVTELMDNLSTSTRVEIINERIDKTLSYYLQRNIRIDNAASAILAHSLALSLESDIGKLIPRYFSKGLHKSERVDIESKIRLQLNE